MQFFSVISYNRDTYNKTLSHDYSDIFQNSKRRLGNECKIHNPFYIKGNTLVASDVILLLSYHYMP